MPSQREILYRRGESPTTTRQQQQQQQPRSSRTTTSKKPTSKPPSSSSNSSSSRRSKTRDAALARKEAVKRCRACKSLAGHPTVAHLLAAHPPAALTPTRSGPSFPSSSSSGGKYDASWMEACNVPGCSAVFLRGMAAGKHRRAYHSDELEAQQAAAFREACVRQQQEAAAPAAAEVEMRRRWREAEVRNAGRKGTARDPIWLE